MTFRSGEKRTSEFIESAKASRKKRFGLGNCYICGTVFESYKKEQRTCRSTECIRENTRRKYKEAKESDPVLSKAITLSGSIRLGKHKREVMRELIASAINKPCDYCQEIVTLENASVDHKEPRTFSMVHNRSKSKKKILYTKEEIRHLDRIENLHIVCRDCNFLKSDMNDEQFKYFVKAMSDRPDVKKKVVDRLKRSVLVFKRFGR